MDWTRHSPNVDGYFWYRRDPGDFVYLLRVGVLEADVRVYEFGCHSGSRSMDYYAGGQWAGPLVAPE